MNERKVPREAQMGEIVCEEVEEERLGGRICSEWRRRRLARRRRSPPSGNQESRPRRARELKQRLHRVLVGRGRSQQGRQHLHLN